jgi:hypothetical protein
MLALRANLSFLRVFVLFHEIFMQTSWKSYATAGKPDNDDDAV